MDARIEGQYTLREAMKVANIAIQCLSVEPRFRPKMDEVVKALEELQRSDDTAGVVGSSRDHTVKRNGHSSGSSSSGHKQHRSKQRETTY
ncbi:putative serine/threonine-protein kinase [Sesbania bispinosa]|nr:putative serine/threonine-protein kinase [Sesbania bispinosa]